MSVDPDICQQRMLITARHDHPVIPHVMRVVDVSRVACPECGNTDIGAWADDGESDLADWWECKRCGLSGAFLHMDPNKNTTPNGLEIS